MDWQTFLGARPLPAVMGIVNVTPDSFSDGGRYLSPEAAFDHGRRLIDEGADLLDVGGESTRPSSYGHADTIDPEEEMRRIVPVIERLAAAASSSFPISVDTRKAPVARAALVSGATIVNDVTALRYDPEMGPAAAAAGAAVILMHMRGTDPATMQDDVAYDDLFGEIAGALAAAAAGALACGIPESRIAIDPGLGFGKTPGQNLLLVGRLAMLRRPGWPVAIGASRKGFVARYSGLAPGTPPEERLAGSLACAEAAAREGAAILRVHDVGPTVRFLRHLRSGGDGAEAAAAAGAPPGPYARMREALQRAAEVGLESSP